MHAWHETAHLVAALILWAGGGAILARAAILRRRARVLPGASPDLPPPDRRAAMASMRRASVIVVAALSGAAAAVHLAAGPDHVAELGDLGLGFYWAAIFQGAFAVAWLTGGGSNRLARAGIAANVALLLAWAWARTVGLPGTSGVESIGLADGTVVALEVALVAALLARLRGLDTHIEVALAPARLATVATSGLVAALGVIALSTTIAVAAAAGGHHAAGHADGAGAPADGHHGATTESHHDTPSTIEIAPDHGH